jgi:hypothetical protein
LRDIGEDLLNAQTQCRFSSPFKFMHFAAGIDDDYIKPGSSKWGDVLERLLGAEGVREELRAYHWSRGL